MVVDPSGRLPGLRPLETVVGAHDHRTIAELINESAKHLVRVLVVARYRGAKHAGLGPRHREAHFTRVRGAPELVAHGVDTP